MRPGRPDLLVLAVDMGSSSTRSALFGDKGNLVNGSSAQRKYRLSYSPDGGAELSPFLLLRALRACLRETLHARQSSPLGNTPIAAVCGSVFWHGLLGLDTKGHALTPVFTWADSRGARDAARLREKFDERTIQAETGCMLRASFWPAKLLWLRRTDRALFRRVTRWVSPADWIFGEIFGTRGTSVSMASGTGLFDRRTQDWHLGLRETCGIDADKLSAISEIDTGNTWRGAVVLSPIGDGAAGNLGCGADGDGRVAINLGTSGAVRMVAKREARREKKTPFGLFRYMVDEKRDVIGGAVSNAGNLRRWSAQQLRVENEEKALDRRAAATDTVTVLPFWVAERAPSWPENVPGVIAELTQATDAAEIFRACTCATFYRLTDILETLESATGRAREIIVSGGVLHSRAALEILADALGRDISISPQAEASLRGAAVYALEKLGYQVRRLPKGKVVRHKGNLAAKHRQRRERQAALEKRFAVS